MQRIDLQKQLTIILLFVAFVSGLAVSQLHRMGSGNAQDTLSVLESTKSLIKSVSPSENLITNTPENKYLNDEPQLLGNALATNSKFEKQLLKLYEIEEILSEFRHYDDFNNRVQRFLKESEQGESKYTTQEILHALLPLLRKGEILESFFSNFPTTHPSWGKFLNEIVTESVGYGSSTFPGWLETHLTAEKLSSAKTVYSNVLSYSFQGAPEEIVTKLDLTVNEQVDAFGRFLARQGSPEDLIASLEFDGIPQSSKARLVSSIAKERGKRDPEAALDLVGQLPDSYSGLRNLERELWASWAELSPEAALRSVAKYTRSPISAENATRSVATRWYITEPGGMIEWLHQSQPGRVRDMVINDLMWGVASPDALSRDVAVDLVESILTPDMRSDALKGFEQTYRE